MPLSTDIVTLKSYAAGAPSAPGPQLFAPWVALTVKVPTGWPGFEVELSGWLNGLTQPAPNVTAAIASKSALRIRSRYQARAVRAKNGAKRKTGRARFRVRPT